mgnify:FL=1
MPKYLYHCKCCQKILGFYHSMNELKKDCAECGTEDSLVKKPSTFNLHEKQDPSAEVGQTVKESIEDFKQDLQSQKEDLQNQYFIENE